MFVNFLSILSLIFASIYFFFQLIRCGIAEYNARKIQQKKLQEEREREIAIFKRAAIRAKLRGDIKNYTKFAKAIKHLQNGGKPFLLQ